MKRFLIVMSLLALSAGMLAACGDAATPTLVPPTATAVPPTAAAANGDPAASSTVQTAGQPQHITVQHILIGFQDAIGFQGSPPAKAQGRTQEQAKTLAYEVLDKAKKGDDFDALVKQYTDDQAPGIYSMSNIGVQPAAADEYPRDQMVAAFGNVGFALQVGEIGIADYDPGSATSVPSSPFGYHIIKRIK